MIAEIYKTMLEIALSTKVTHYIELTYHIDEEQSKKFWADKSLQNEHEALLEEWDYEDKNRYKKTLYGTKFAIQFNH